MSELKIIATGDGSHSLLNTALNETYHSVHGAHQESVHVFIQQGLDFFLRHHATRTVSIFEMGFGTGLNALLTAEYAAQFECDVHYTSLESFPLPEDVWRSLNYADSEESKGIFEKLHLAPWNEKQKINDRFVLHKIHSTLQQLDLSTNSFGLIYFDAFAPNKQPELWTKELMSKIAGAMSLHGVFVTYCAKGQVKRDLRDSGLLVETLPGPPGKKEMTRALKK